MAGCGSAVNILAHINMNRENRHPKNSGLLLYSTHWSHHAQSLLALSHPTWDRLRGSGVLQEIRSESGGFTMFHRFKNGMGRDFWAIFHP